jgi:hypothetical protein
VEQPAHLDQVDFAGAGFDAKLAAVQVAHADAACAGLNGRVNVARNIQCRATFPVAEPVERGARIERHPHHTPDLLDVDVH